ncbi:MAG: nitrogenase component 1 [Elusimicrobia bacterium]|nr:nitrogenase component 1 [Elusimicrobiota bacterium]
MPAMHVSAGPQALAALARILGLREGAGWRLEGLCCEGGRSVRVSLSARELRLVFYILPPGAPAADARTAGLALAAEAGAGPAARRFLETAARRLGRRTFREVRRLLEEDPLSFREPAGSGEDRVKVPCIGQPMGLLEDGWRNFFADQDFEVLLGVPEALPHGMVNVQYADLECYYARPRRSFRKWGFLDWPEETQEEIRRRSQDAAPEAEKRQADSLIVTELEESDMILGTGQRADALVAEVRKVAGHAKFLVFTHLCTPIVLGEDFQGLARRCRREIRGVTLGWSQKDRDIKDNFGEHLRALAARPGFFAGKGDARLVNLFHFAPGVREAELKPFLAELGLKTGVCAFPDVDFPSLERIPEARWQVFCEMTLYPTKLRELLQASPRQVLTVPAPYGLAGTRECLSRIASAAGREAAFAKAWKRRLAGFLPAWEALRRQASGLRLAFVVSESTLPGLLRPRYGHGAPLAAMVREMGFGMDLLYYDRHGRAPELPAGLAGARVTTFRSPWELERALREGEFPAVYSDIRFDWRLNRAGKARFSSRDVEPGLEGARRTLERLLAVCRLPFYRRYAGALAKVPRKAHA